MTFAPANEIKPEGLLLRIAGERGAPMKAQAFDQSKVSLETERGGILLANEKVVGLVVDTTTQVIGPR